MDPYLKFSRENRPEKNSEIFTILQSHNKLSAKHLHEWPLFAVDNSQAAAPIPASAFRVKAKHSRAVSSLKVPPFFPAFIIALAPKFQKYPDKSRPVARPLDQFQP
jgi:hypothetical protein